MGLKLQDAIPSARRLLSDKDGDRYSDADLLEFANQAVLAMVPMVPQYFNTTGQVECVPLQTLQTIGFDGAVALVDVIGRADGYNVPEADLTALSAYNPNWQQAAAGPAINWLRSLDSPLRFYVSPPAPNNQILSVIYTAIPTAYAATDDTGLPRTLTPAIVDYIVYLAESSNDEAINTGRAQQFLASFTSRLSSKG